MVESDNAQFIKYLRITFDLCDKPLPSTDAIVFWFKILSPFSLEQVAQALQHHARTSRFAPKPVDIIELLTAGDGRPGADEAWAIAQASIDENATVVWSKETAQAFAEVQSLINGQSVAGESYIETKGEDAGKTKTRYREIKPDMIAARRSFIAIYERLVAEARARNEKPHYQASLGRDAGRRADVLRLAESRGLLPAEHVAGLLPAPTAIEPVGPDARSQVRMILEMLEQSQQTRDERAAKALAEREEHDRKLHEQHDQKYQQAVADGINQPKETP